MLPFGSGTTMLSLLPKPCWFGAIPTSFPNLLRRKEGREELPASSLAPGELRRLSCTQTAFPIVCLMPVSSARARRLLFSVIFCQLLIVVHLASPLPTYTHCEIEKHNNGKWNSGFQASGCTWFGCLLCCMKAHWEESGRIAGGNERG